jgi:hypothetical protein
MIKKFITNLVRSLDNIQHQGYSARKLTALFGVLMGAYITKYHLPEADQFYALICWLLLALLCLGIVTFEQIIKLKNGSDEKHSDTDNDNTNSDTAK